jgi:hypothetical protein
MVAHRSHCLIKAWAVMAVIAAAGFFPVSAQAALVFDLSSTFNGDTPTSTPPYLTAQFANTATPGTVRLTLTSSLDITSEYIAAVAFNIDPAIIPSSLTITPVSCVTCTTPTFANTTDNGQQLNGGGSQAFDFDVLLTFASAAAGRFNGSDVAIIDITAAGLTENDFNFTNSPADDLFIAADVRGIPCAIGPDCPDGTTSGAVTVGGEGVPEPSPLAIMGTVLLGLGFIRWRRKLA